MPIFEKLHRQQLDLFSTFFCHNVQEMLHQTRKDNSGVQLEVNERILDACTDLMKV